LVALFSSFTRFWRIHGIQSALSVAVRGGCLSRLGNLVLPIPALYSTAFLWKAHAMTHDAVYSAKSNTALSSDRTENIVTGRLVTGSNAADGPNWAGQPGDKAH
jgi:hypothetical protein